MPPASPPRMAPPKSCVPVWAGTCSFQHSWRGRSTTWYCVALAAIGKASAAVTHSSDFFNMLVLIRLFVIRQVQPLLIALGDLVADIAAANGARNRRQGPAIATAYLISQQSA